MSQVIALHGDYSWPTMLARDVGDIEPSIDLFWDANGWRRADREIDRLEAFIRTLDEPPTMIGYSRGGSVIAALSERVELRPQSSTSRLCLILMALAVRFQC